MDYRIGGLNIKNIRWQQLFLIVFDNSTDQLVTVKVKEARKTIGRASATDCHQLKSYLRIGARWLRRSLSSPNISGCELGGL